MRGSLNKATVVAVMSLMATAADARDETKPRAKLLQQTLDCIAIKTDAERLACYDRTVTALGKGEESREIVVSDREQIRETRRSLFGFRLPSLFGGKDDGELDKIEATISSVSRSYEGGLMLAVDGGARWEQVDSRAIVGKIRPGDKVTISRGTMGAYFATLAGRPSFKVQRRE
ncbi:MAG: hypothetical protein JF608_09080 [Sphingomonadales bacterium]|jgi:hypothetical protein|nr:hypothetical protein [Sphingomonadales bacterium]